MGSGISSYGELSISNSVISSNTVESSAQTSRRANMITLSARRTSGNLSGGGPAGGSISNYGALSISNSRIENNTDNVGLGVGGIVSVGTLTLVNSKVLNNTGSFTGGIFTYSGASISNSVIASNKGNNGGGIMAYEGTTFITNSTIANNISTTETDMQHGNPLALNYTIPLDSHSGGDGPPTPQGGGISNYVNGTLLLENSTISGNKTGGHGGGIDNIGSLFIRYSTIYNNSAMKGGGIAIEGYTYKTDNNSNNTYEVSASVIAGNQAANSPDIAGPITLSDPNLIQNLSGATISYLHDYYGSINPLTLHLITGKSPQLAPLQMDVSYPDVPPTHALLPDSPAIDQIPPGDDCGRRGDSISSIDERGVSRPQGKGCDLGAYEYVPTT